MAALRRATVSRKMVIVDEIGKLELLCESFEQAVSDEVEAENPVLATAMSGAHPWIDDLKAKPKVELWRVTVKNRDVLAEQAFEWLVVDAEAEQRYNEVTQM